MVRHCAELPRLYDGGSHQFVVRCAFWDTSGCYFMAALATDGWLNGWIDHFINPWGGGD